ncbi:MAG: hypothetical protein AB8G99_24235 [Planctomycetaceae bacterium]
MKHFVLMLLLYVIAIVQTSGSIPPFTIDPMVCIAACVLVFFAHQPALIWITLIGLMNDVTGSQLIGTTAFSYLAVAFIARTAVPHAHKRPLHITACTTLAFVVCASLPRTLQLSGDLQGLLSFTTSVLLTWFVVVTVLLLRSLLVWLAERFRQSPAASGAVGTPVGLQVR